MQNLRTPVNNKSDIQVRINDHYICDFETGGSFYGSTGFDIPARRRNTIRSGKFIDEHMNWGFYQDIHLLSGEKVLVVLRGDDFQNNKGKELVLESRDGRFRCAFVDPKQGITSAAQWIWDEPPVLGAVPGADDEV